MNQKKDFSKTKPIENTILHYLSKIMVICLEVVNAEKKTDPRRIINKQINRQLEKIINVLSFYM